MQQEELAHEPAARSGEEGSAIVVALLVLVLLSAFVALALSRTTTEAIVMGNDAANTRAQYAAQASLEFMTIKFNRLFDAQLNPDPASYSQIEGAGANPPGFTEFSFVKDIVPPAAGSAKPMPITSGQFDGLNALQDTWILRATARGPSGAEVSLARRFLNNRIPIFQFGAFFDDDLELHSGTPFSFRGRVHTNGHFFVKGSPWVHFDSRVSAAGHIVPNMMRNGSSGSGNIFFCPQGKNCAADNSLYVRLAHNEGSVLDGPDVTSSDAQMPDGTLNGGWAASRARFRSDPNLPGNLESGVAPIRLPLKLKDEGLDNIELIKRGRSTDTNTGNEILRRSRYFNKSGIRVTLSDTRARLPGGTGGIRLDGDSDGAGGQTTPDRGYRPQPMGTYQATRFNAHRIFTGASYDGNPRQTWIKVERVKVNDATQDAEATDITADFLKMGLTEKAPRLLDPATGNKLFALPDSYYTNNTDDRSIIKLQRFAITGMPLRASTPANSAASPANDATLSTKTAATPQMTRVDAQINFSWGTGVVDAARFNENETYKVRWTGQIRPTATGTWKFRTTSDDGLRLAVFDGAAQVLYLDKWYDQGGANGIHESSAVNLDSSKWYNVVIEYYENGGDAAARLEWAQSVGGNYTFGLVPSSNLRTPDLANPASTVSGLRGDYYAHNYDAHAYAYVDPDNDPSDVDGLSCVTLDNYFLPGEETLAASATVADKIYLPFERGEITSTSNTTTGAETALPIIDDGAFAYTNTWTTQSNSSVNGGVHRINETAGSTFTVNFTTPADVVSTSTSGNTTTKTTTTTKTRIELIVVRDPSNGRAQVSVDGGTATTVDLRGTVDYNHKILDVGNLPAGPHYVTVRVLGTTSNTAAGAGKWVRTNFARVYNTETTRTDTTTVTPISATPTPATINTRVVPFPIEMIDPREGLYNTELDAATVYPNQRVPLMGKMSMVDIDLRNFRRYAAGEFDADLSADARGANLPRDNGGYIIYVSDRRGDRDDDGELDMENIYVDKNNPNNSDTKQAGEDVNRDGVLNIDYDWEAPRYRIGTDSGSRNWTIAENPLSLVRSQSTEFFAETYTDLAALFDHKYFRRGVRAINGEQLPGDKNAGFTLASENGVYVQGNFNAKGVTSIPANNAPIPPGNYCPNADNPGVCTGALAGGTQVPASIVADAVTVLSNNWRDSQSFRDPFHERGRKLWHSTGGANTWGITGTATTYRMAVLAGDTQESLCYGAPDGCNPNQGADHPRMNGALHEGIIRFIEHFGQPVYGYTTAPVNVNYCGSFINLFNSRNNTGSFKVKQPEFHVFRQPTQNNTFDDSFTDPTRIPPGTPFFQYVQVTGFIQDNLRQTPAQ